MSIDINLFKNTPFALLIWYIKDGQEDEASVFPGLATWNNQTKTLDILSKESDELVMSISENLFERIQIVSDDMKEIFDNCTYAIPLYMTDMPNDAIPDELTSTSIDWGE